MPTALMLASAAAESKLEVNGALKVVELFGEGSGLWLTESVIVQWIVILILLAVVLILTHNLKPVPETRRQAAAEMLVEFVRDTVHGTMGTKYNAYTPYIMTLLCYIMINNLMGLMGLRNPTADVSVTGTFALMTFVLVQYNRAKTGKFKGYFKSFIEPLPFMLPFNIIGEVANPLALALRLFGNMIAGTVIGGLIYFALGNFAVLVPAVASLYFDIFSAVMQSYIFIMLSMSYISSAECDS